MYGCEVQLLQEALWERQISIKAKTQKKDFIKRFEVEKEHIYREIRVPKNTVQMIERLITIGKKLNGKKSRVPQMTKYSYNVRLLQSTFATDLT